jgi:cobaltochelatase CobS
MTTQNSHSFITGTAFGLDPQIKVRCPHGDPVKSFHPRVPKINKQYTFNERFVSDLRRLLPDSGGDILCSYGDSGEGKTSGYVQFAARVGWPLYEIQGTQELSFQLDLLGRINPATGDFIPGACYSAMTEGGILLINEADAMNAAELVSFYDLITNGIQVVETGEWVTPHPLFRVIFTFNNGGLSGLSGMRGTTVFSEALIDRFIYVGHNSLEESDLINLCEASIDFHVEKWKTELGQTITAPHAKAIKALVPQMVKVMNNINTAVNEAKDGNYESSQGAALDKRLSTRGLLRWCRELLRIDARSARNRLKKTFIECYAHRVRATPAAFDATLHLCKSVFGDNVWVED